MVRRDSGTCVRVCVSWCTRNCDCRLIKSQRSTAPLQISSDRTTNRKPGTDCCWMVMMGTVAAAACRARDRRRLCHHHHHQQLWSSCACGGSTTGAGWSRRSTPGLAGTVTPNGVYRHSPQCVLPNSMTQKKRTSSLSFSFPHSLEGTKTAEQRKKNTACCRRLSLLRCPAILR